MLKVRFEGMIGTLNMSVDIQAGHGVTALYGPSGAGKSTILRAIAGLWKPSEGHIQVGENILYETSSGLNVPTHKRKLGMVFQEPLLFPHMTVTQNLNYANGGQPPRWDAVIQLLDLQNLLGRMPRNLSGGEAQRVALGRSLLADPSILLLDEPMTGLDDTRRDEVLPYFVKLRDETMVPIVYVSHNVGEIMRLADSVVMVENGISTEQLTPAEFQRVTNLPPALKRDRA